MGPGETMGVIAFMVIAIVTISTIGGIFKKRYEHKGANQEALAKIQADLNELKKSVAEMREYITDMYIQQHDQRLLK